MRVCYVSSTFDPDDGWGRYSREVINAVRATGVEPIVATTREAETTGVEAGAFERVLPPVPLRRAEMLRQFGAGPGLRRAARSCDLVHLLVEPYLPMVALVTPRTRPLVMTAHGTWAVQPLVSRLTGWMYARALHRPDLVVCQSAVTRDAITRVGPLGDHVVLPGGVSIETFEKPGAPIDRVPPGAAVVLTVGAVKRRKGHDLALAVLSRVAETVPNLHWLVDGDTSADPEWFDALRWRALGAKRLTVHWLGRVSENVLLGCYQRAAVFLLLPVEVQGAFEGLGLVLLEAAASGVPAVTCGGSGAAEAVRHLDTGVVVGPGDVESAADAVAALLANEGRRLEMGVAARAFARERSWTQLATALSGHYAALVARRSRSAGA